MSVDWNELNQKSLIKPVHFYCLQDKYQNFPLARQHLRYKSKCKKQAYSKR